MWKMWRTMRLQDLSNQNENLMEKLHEAYKTYLDEMENDYVERADHIISEWESNVEEDIVNDINRYATQKYFIFFRNQK